MQGEKRNPEGLSFRPAPAALAGAGRKVFAALAHAGAPCDASSIKESHWGGRTPEGLAQQQSGTDEGALGLMREEPRSELRGPVDAHQGKDGSRLHVGGIVVVHLKPHELVKVKKLHGHHGAIGFIHGFLSKATCGYIQTAIRAAQPADERAKSWCAHDALAVLHLDDNTR